MRLPEAADTSACKWAGSSVQELGLAPGSAGSAAPELATAGWSPSPLGSPDEPNVSQAWRRPGPAMPQVPRGHVTWWALARSRLSPPLLTAGVLTLPGSGPGTTAPAPWNLGKGQASAPVLQSSLLTSPLSLRHHRGREARPETNPKSFARAWRSDPAEECPEVKEQLSGHPLRDAEFRQPPRARWKGQQNQELSF